MDDKKEKLLSHFLNVGTGNLISAFLGFITMPIITRLFMPEEYGIYSLFYLYGNMAMIILCLGMDQSLVRYYYDQSTKEYKVGLLRQCIKLPLCVTLVLALIYFANAILGVVPKGGDLLLSVLLAGYVLLLLLNRFALVLLRLEKKSRLYGAINVLQKLIDIGVIFSILFVIKKNNAEVLCLGIITAVFFSSLFSVLGNKELWVYKGHVISEHSTSELMKYAYPYIITLGLTSLFQALDRMAISHFCDYHDVGVYSSAVSLLRILGIIQTSFTTIWMPNAIDRYKKNPKDLSYFSKVCQIVTVIMFVLGASFVLFKDLFILLLGKEYREAVTILPFLAMEPIMYTISETTVVGIVFSEKSKLQILAPGFACMFNVFGNLILVSRYGAIGAAISTGLSYVLFMVIRTILSNKCMDINFKMNKILIITLAFLLYASYSSTNTFSVISVVGYIILVLLIAFCYREIISEFVARKLEF